MRRLRARRRGIAMADFIAGSLIFSATLGVFVGFTNVKFETLRQSEALSRANAAVEAEVDRLRELGAIAAPQGEAGLDGFRALSSFEVPDVNEGSGEVAARALRVEGGQAYQLYEVRVRVRWRSGAADYDRVSSSLVLPLRAGGAR
ncbi:MAG: hypothetical protein R3F62_13790 [Planctomycetota bacterium]